MLLRCAGGRRGGQSDERHESLERVVAEGALELRDDERPESSPEESCIVGILHEDGRPSELRRSPTAGGGSGEGEDRPSRSRTSVDDGGIESELTLVRGPSMPGARTDQEWFVGGGATSVGMMAPGQKQCWCLAGPRARGARRPQVLVAVLSPPLQTDLRPLSLGDTPFPNERSTTSDSSENGSLGYWFTLLLEPTGGRAARSWPRSGTASFRENLLASR